MSDIVNQAFPACEVRCPGTGACARLKCWAKRLRQTERARRELNGLTDRELGDIGLSRCQLNYVANGTFSR